jgi:hypothetical protein
LVGECGEVNGLEEHDIVCPYCGEVIGILVDLSVPQQTYTEDCQVCCCPAVITVETDAGGRLSVTAAREDD